MPDTYINPSETGFYYLNSRYYDPIIGRFINADNALYQSILGYNLFVYCNNSPINYYDPSGEAAETLLKGWMSTMWWMTLVDGVLPLGDIVYYSVAAIIGVTAIKVVSIGIANSKNDDVKKEDNNDKPVVLPGQQPTEKEGYVPPKGGPTKGKTKDGQLGWKDKNGNIWIPQPTGSNGAHGGGHWDVQSPKGGYINVYPGGNVRGGKAPYPKISIFP